VPIANSTAEALAQIGVALFSNVCKNMKCPSSNLCPHGAQNLTFSTDVAFFPFSRWNVILQVWLKKNLEQTHQIA